MGSTSLYVSWGAKDGGLVHFEIEGIGQLVGHAKVADRKWHHIVLAYHKQSTKCSIYVDLALDSTKLIAPQKVAHKVFDSQSDGKVKSWMTVMEATPEPDVKHFTFRIGATRAPLFGATLPRNFSGFMTDLVYWNGPVPLSDMLQEASNSMAGTLVKAKKMLHADQEQQLAACRRSAADAASYVPDTLGMLQACEAAIKSAASMKGEVSRIPVPVAVIGARTSCNRTDIRACPAGKFFHRYSGDRARDGAWKRLSAEQSGFCQPCPAGRFDPSDGLHLQCLACTLGKIASHPGATACLACADKTEVANLGRTACAATCAPGQVADESLHVCKPCDSGKYQPMQGGRNSTCIACPAGKYEKYYAAGGESWCFDCTAGKHQPWPGRTSCRLCPADKYQLNAKQTACQQCPAGKYQNAAGAYFCKQGTSKGWGKVRITQGTTSDGS
jgi:hypothetical protein